MIQNVLNSMFSDMDCCISRIVNWKHCVLLPTITITVCIKIKLVFVPSCPYKYRNMPCYVWQCWASSPPYYKQISWLAKLTNHFSTVVINAYYMKVCMDLTFITKWYLCMWKRSCQIWDLHLHWHPSEGRSICDCNWQLISDILLQEWLERCLERQQKDTTYALRRSCSF